MLWIDRIIEVQDVRRIYSVEVDCGKMTKYRRTNFAEKVLNNLISIEKAAFSFSWLVENNVQAVPIENDTQFRWGWIIASRKLIKIDVSNLHYNQVQIFDMLNDFNEELLHSCLLTKSCQKLKESNIINFTPDGELALLNEA